MKKKKLKDMNIEEVSIVDKGANHKRWFLIKREDGEITELTIKTDGTADGTTLSVNGEEVNDLKAFWFSLWPSDDFDEGMMNGSYTVTETDGAEFDRETTFNLKKGMNTMKLEEVLKAFKVDPKTLAEEENEDLKSLIKFIDRMPPVDAESALNVIKRSLVKEEAAAQEAEETPAEEDMAPEKVSEIKGFMALLNDSLPESERSVLKSEEPDKLDLILAILAKASKAKGSAEDDDSDDAPESENAILQSLIKRVTKVEKTTGVSDDDDEEEAGDQSALEAYEKLAKEEKIKKYGTVYAKTQANMGFDLKSYLEGK